jgi:hypothetical protein
MNRQADIYKDLDEKVMIADKFHSELLREAHEINSLCDNKYPFLFISDDYVDAKIKNDPEITRCMTIYRNANVSSIFSFQGRTLMSAVGRNNANYIAIFKQQTPLEFENSTTVAPFWDIKQDDVLARSCAMTRINLRQDGCIASMHTYIAESCLDNALHIANKYCA